MNCPEPRGEILRESDLAALEKTSWIDGQTAQSALLRRVDSTLGAELIGKKPSEGDFSGLVIPYLWPGTDPGMKAAGLPDQRSISLYRLRRDRPDIRIGTGNVRQTVGKYMAAPGARNRLYFHPETEPEWLDNDDLPIVIVEGEKKALALWRLAWWDLPADASETPRFLPVGLSGVWNWRGKTGKEDAPDGGKQTVKGPLPDLDRIAWHDRRVVILFDANVATNDEVKRARLALAEHLWFDRHARVCYATIPPKIEGVNGIDDFLAARGPEKGLKLIEAAREKKFRETPEQSAAATGKDERLEKIFSGVEWIQTPNDELFASIDVDGHKETVGLRTRKFRSFLMRRVMAIDGEVTIQKVTELFAHAEAKADASPAVTPVHLRVAGAGSTIYIDTANHRWESIAINAEGYRVATETEVRFRRSRTMAPQVSPVPGGSLELLRRFCNLESDENFVLVCAWLVGAMAPTGPYPVLNVRGEQGSAKSTTSKILRLLVDPAGGPGNYYSGAIKSPPKDERDLMISAGNSWVMVFDNMSGIKPEMSDCLCRLSTGGAFSTRLLHSDDEEKVFEAMRPMIMNGIDDMATMPDLLDRSLMLDLPAISESARRAESEFWREFELERPRIFGALCRAVSAAVKFSPAVQLERAPRMADFARWVCGACDGGALPFDREKFLEVYFGNRDDATASAIEASPLATELERLVKDLGRWEGTATDLLLVLNDRASDGLKLSKAWPKDVRSIGNRLRRVSPLLRAAGIRLGHSREGKARTRLLSFAAPSELGAEISGLGSVDVRQRPLSDAVF